MGIRAIPSSPVKQLLHFERPLITHDAWFASLIQILNIESANGIYTLFYEETRCFDAPGDGVKIYTPGDYSHQIPLVKGQLWCYMRHIMSNNPIHCVRHWTFISKNNAGNWMDRETVRLSNDVIHINIYIYRLSAFRSLRIVVASQLIAKLINNASQQ